MTLYTIAKATPEEVAQAKKDGLEQFYRDRARRIRVHEKRLLKICDILSESKAYLIDGVCPCGEHYAVLLEGRDTYKICPRIFLLWCVRAAVERNITEEFWRLYGEIKVVYDYSGDGPSFDSNGRRPVWSRRDSV